MICGKCGSNIPEGAVFCPYCGNKSTVPQNIKYCPMCGAALNNGQIFCSNCGTACGHGGGQQTNSIARTLIISRKAQFVCSLTSYKVFVDGIDLGNIGVGKSLFANISADTVRVEIKCTTVLMTGIRLFMLLKVTQNPKVEFELQYGGAISATVSGAEILQQES